MDRSEKYYRSSSSVWPGVFYSFPVSDKNVESKILLCFEIGCFLSDDYLYFGIARKRNNDGSLNGENDEISEYVWNNVTPSDIKERKEKYGWFWKKYLNEKCPVKFKGNNDEYYKLFDQKCFDDYMKGVYEFDRFGFEKH